MTEALHQILQTYLDCGYQDTEQFWRMTLPELYELLKSAERRMKRDQKQHEIETKERIVTLRNLALQTAEATACLFDKNKKSIRSLSEYYPGLFEDERAKEMSLENYTAMFVDFAFRHNQARKRQRGGDASEPGHRNTEEIAGSADREHATAPDGDEAGARRHQDSD